MSKISEFFSSIFSKNKHSETVKSTVKGRDLESFQKRMNEFSSGYPYKVPEFQIEVENNLISYIKSLKIDLHFSQALHQNDQGLI